MGRQVDALLDTTTQWLGRLGSRQQQPTRQRVPTALLPTVQEEEGGEGGGAGRISAKERESWAASAAQMAANAAEAAEEAAAKSQLFYVKWLVAGTAPHDRALAEAHAGAGGTGGGKPWEAGETGAREPASWL